MPSLLRPSLPDAKGSPQGRKTVWQRLQEHFEATGNEWIGIADATKATGISKPNVCQAFYVAHKNDVESKPDPARLSGRLWRLAENKI